MIGLITNMINSFTHDSIFILNGSFIYLHATN